MFVDSYIEELIESIESVDLNDFCVECGLVGVRGVPTNDDRIEGLIRMLEKQSIKIKFKDNVYSLYTGSYWHALASNDSNMKFYTVLKEVSLKIGYSKDVNKLKKVAAQIKLEFYEKSSTNNKPMINLLNGTLVLDEDRIYLKEFDLNDNLSYQMDFDYVEDAPENEIFMQYLDKVLPDKNTQRTLQQALGYLFVNNLKLEKMLILYGKGSNGKSIIFEIINTLLGSNNVTNMSLNMLLNDKFSLPSIQNKIVNYCSDIDFNKLRSGIGLLKQIVSQETITVRPASASSTYEISNYAKLIFNTNSLAGLKSEKSHGFTRRFVIIPFDQEIKSDESDRDLHKKILENKSAILNWILVGAREVLKSRDIYISERCEQVKNDYLNEIDTVKLFSKDVFSTLPKGLNVTAIYDEYKNFCDANGYVALIRSRFIEKMQVLGHEKKKISQGETLLSISHYKTA